MDTGINDHTREIVPELMVIWTHPQIHCVLTHGYTYGPSSSARPATPDVAEGAPSATSGVAGLAEEDAMDTLIELCPDLWTH